MLIFTNGVRVILNYGFVLHFYCTRIYNNVFQFVVISSSFYRPDTETLIIYTKFSPIVITKNNIFSQLNYLFLPYLQVYTNENNVQHFLEQPHKPILRKLSPKRKRNYTFTNQFIPQINISKLCIHT